VGLLSTRSFAMGLIVLALSMGCSTRLDRHWGEASTALNAAQVAHPEPTATNVESIDGVTAEMAVESMRNPIDSAPAPLPTLIEISSD
jgi:hypothetical protein